jgi:hypothetical protein
MRWPRAASHPRALGPDDLPAMLASGKPFARKLDAAADPDLVARLRARLG